MGNVSSPWRQKICRRLSPVMLVALSAAGAAALPNVPAMAQTPGAAASDQAVIVRGNQRIESDTILAYIDFEPGQTIGAEDLNQAVRRLFETGLFRDVRITPSGNQLIVDVVENPSISEIAFEGNKAITDEDLQQIVSLRSRLPFTVSAAETDAQRIIELYRRLGHYGAEVEPVIIERSENRVDLVFEIDEGKVTSVRSIDFTGNRKFSNRRLRRVIETSETGLLSFFTSSDVYDPDRLELDKELLRNFYFERGYADFSVLSATAELSPDREGFFITFTVDEGELYRFGEMSVEVAARGLDSAEFAAALPDLSGKVYDASKVEEIADELTDLAGQRGFAFVQVRPRARKDEEERTIDITFEIGEGPRVFVERIDIEGNTQTLDRVIRRQIKLVEGDPFDARKIRDAQRRIRGLDYFSRVEIVPEEGSAEDRAVLKVRVEEEPTGSLSFGIGYASSAGPIGNVALTERNFLGRGQYVNFQLTAAGDTQVYDFAFTEPAFLDRDLSVGMRAFFIDDNRTDESNFKITRLGFSPTIGFPLAENFRASLRYEFRRDDLRVNRFASPAIKIDDGARISSSVGYTLTYDGRNDPIEPTWGYLLRADNDFYGLGGDARAIKGRGTAKGWAGFFDDQVIASLEAEVGAIYPWDGDVRINERFFLGGSKLRGFAPHGVGPRDTATGDALGGKYSAAARFEVSFPLGLPEELGIYGGLFVDAGTLFGLDGNPIGKDGLPIDDSAQFRVGAGGLLYLDTPFGPLEMSFGVPIVKESYDEREIFRLSIGTRF